MKKIFSVTLSTLTVAILSACGGGGSSIPTPVPITPYTQADIKNVAGLGVLTAEIIGGQIPLLQALWAALIQGSSTINSGSAAAATESCATNTGGSGTLTVSTTKSAVRLGLASGDSTTLSFANCDVGGAGLFLNGSVVLTATAPAINLPTTNYSVSHVADLSSFSMRSGASTLSLTGNIVSSYATSTTTGSNASLTVLAGKNLVTAVSTNGGVSLTTNYSANTTVIAADSATRRTRKLDGALTLITSTVTRVLEITTPTILSAPAGGRFIPTAGTIRARDVGRDIGTSTTFNVTSAVVSGDTDRNGSLDLTYPTTWSALTN